MIFYDAEIDFSVKSEAGFCAYFPVLIRKGKFLLIPCRGSEERGVYAFDKPFGRIPRVGNLLERLDFMFRTALRPNGERKGDLPCKKNSIDFRFPRKSRPAVSTPLGSADNGNDLTF